MAGRKSKYYSHVQPRLEEVLEWKKQGLKESAIAKNLGVGLSAFNVYKKQFPQLMDTIKRGNIKIAEIAEDSLIQGIQGHYVEETETTVETDGNNKKKQRVKKVKKWIPANPTLIIFALKNRNPDEWKDRQETHHSGGLNMNIIADYGDTDE